MKSSSKKISDKSKQQKISGAESKSFVSRNLLTILLSVIVLLLLGITVNSVVLPSLKKTDFYKQTYQHYIDNKWITYTSQRAQFSFDHPISWPVSSVDFEIKNGMYKYLQNKGIIEYIDFEEEFSSQAGSPSLGFITAEKTTHKNLEEYVNEINKDQKVEMVVRGELTEVIMLAPKIEYLEIGGIDAISVIPADSINSLSSPIKDYRLVRNGLLYRFATVDSTRFTNNLEENSETFENIMMSVKFF